MTLPATALFPQALMVVPVLGAIAALLSLEPDLTIVGRAAEDDAAAGDIAVGVDIGDAVDRSRMHPHS